MKEELISFITAKLAKEKGFYGDNVDDCRNYFIHEKSQEDNIFLQFKKEDYFYYQPSQSLLQRWLREIHHIHISVEVTDMDTYFLNIWDKRQLNNDYFNYFYSIYGLETRVGVDNKEFSSYEEALEVGLIESLKLI